MAGATKIGDMLQTTIIPSQTWLSGPNRPEPEVCPDCQRMVPYLEIEVLGQKRLIRGSCPCRTEAIEAAERELRFQERKRRIERHFQLAQLGPRFGKATFQSWESNSGTQTAFQEARRYVTEKIWEKGDGLLLYGDPGTGKSHLAAAIVNAVIPQGVVAVFQNIPELLLKFRTTFHSNSGVDETGILRTLVQADLVVLDDIGAEQMTEWALGKVYEVVNSLNYFEKALIVTTNFEPTELGQRVGPRIYDRLLEMCKLIEVKGTSYRRLKAERRMEPTHPRPLSTGK